MDTEILMAWLPILLLLSLWEGIWKAIALWKAAKNNQLAWYICILIFNTVGILPIVYLKFFQKRS
ncbi:hypothetical protein CVU76_02405 [Candidatus Dojkabacteria bacterium HGW-Dojkabacteria-1]|uniref:DUF5652 domain-containing protein n=1 Tax=Candidatus Dojkabacteria bacterium HGW-Dojkabacteria-1 TaxID=2013761 RepID=A0A2N2F3X7_9BACT|nr:MAG: hypothetical protein CVU76_02405 [Candidatus Dojkabacteria bacterium HGW-Dojkabacteria-1]